MKNLNLLYQKSIEVLNSDLSNFQLDYNGDNLVYFASDMEIFQTNQQNSTTKSIFKLDESRIVEFHHSSICEELYIAAESGEIFCLNLINLKSETINFCEGGIETIVWSPDEEIVVYASKQNSIFILNSGYDPICMHDLTDESFGANKFITVGWGKKETQFHGTAGKQAAKEHTDSAIKLTDDQIDRHKTIVWRGDGELFAVSFVRDTIRMFQVFDREGQLQYTSEKCNGLESAFDWRPSGSWIGIPQIFPNKYVITLFEKNGLKHREIVLPFSSTEEPVVRLLWNNDSDVLAIETYSKCSNKSFIYLFTVCNYHWYIKQILPFSVKIRTFQWDQKYNEGKTLHVLLENGVYALYRWEFTVNHSPSLKLGDESIVAVIDGKDLLLTNFRQVVIPPPMCGQTLKCDNQINFAGFLCNPSNQNAFFTIDTENTFMTYQWNPKELRLLNKYSFIETANSNIGPTKFNHWMWIEDKLVLATKTESNSSVLCLFEVNDSKNSLIIADSMPFDGVIGAMKPIQDSENQRKIIVHLTTGSVNSICINENKKFANSVKIFSLETFCENIHALSSNKSNTTIYALKNKQTLYLNTDKLASDVTSMFLTNEFLAFTTLDQLKFVRLSDGQIINERQMERGGKIVVIVSNDSRTVLQMPRGNLETIQPRLLSLHIIGKLLNNGEYSRAYDLMRKQRINLNLIVDHNPDKFINDIDRFIENIGNGHWLNLFLSDLQNADVTITMYNSNYTDRKFAYDQWNGEKIVKICERMCEALARLGEKVYFLPIITTYVKQNNLEKALAIIWRLKEEEMENNLDKKDSNIVTAQEALKYLLYLVDVNELYNVALGMYDFNIVLFVAAKSQKDPKEYLPFLNELKQLEETYRKYKIDCHLKRYEKALQNISILGEDRIDEALELIGKHNLYANALRLYKSSDVCYKKIAFAFGEHLRIVGKFSDACLMYERSGDYNQAILSAKHILDWQKCVTLSSRLGSSEEDIKQLMLSLLPALQANGKHIDAALLALKYGQDSLLTVQILCDGQCYAEALYEARLNAENLIDEVIKPHLSHYTDILTQTFVENSNQFIKHKSRLESLRKEKENRKLNGFTDENDLDECDLLSDTSSMNSSRFTGSSRGSTKSHRSSKNRRKHERKLLNLKEGNPFEDIALIDALYNLAQKSYNQQEHIRSICRTLIDLDLDDKGLVLQRTFGELLVKVKDSLDEIWIPEMVTSTQVPIDGTVDYLKFQDEQHYALIKPHQRFKPQLNKIDWEFEVLK